MLRAANAPGTQYNVLRTGSCEIGKAYTKVRRTTQLLGGRQAKELVPMGPVQAGRLGTAEM